MCIETRTCNLGNLSTMSFISLPKHWFLFFFFKYSFVVSWLIMIQLSLQLRATDSYLSFKAVILKGSDFYSEKVSFEMYLSVLQRLYKLNFVLFKYFLHWCVRNWSVLTFPLFCFVVITWNLAEAALGWLCISYPYFQGCLKLLGFYSLHATWTASSQRCGLYIRVHLY